MGHLAVLSLLLFLGRSDQPPSLLTTSAISAVPCISLFHIPDWIYPGFDRLFNFASRSSLYPGRSVWTLDKPSHIAVIW